MKHEEASASTPTRKVTARKNWLLVQFWSSELSVSKNLTIFFHGYLYSFGSRSLVYQIFIYFYFWPLLVQFWSKELHVSKKMTKKFFVGALYIFGPRSLVYQKNEKVVTCTVLLLGA